MNLKDINQIFWTSLDVANLMKTGDILICNHQAVVRFRAGAPTDVIQLGCRIRGAVTVCWLTQASPWQPGCPIQR